MQRTYGIPEPDGEADILTSQMLQTAAMDPGAGGGDALGFADMVAQTFGDGPSTRVREDERTPVLPAARTPGRLSPRPRRRR